MARDFTTGFMPNIKFKGTRDIELFLNEHNMVNFFHARRGTVYGFVTSEDGSMIFAFNEFIYNSFMVQEVSIYEAIPQFIPYGMRYNKELDKLVPDVVANKSVDYSGIKVEFEKVADYTKENHRDYNVGSSNYAAMKIQPWDVWRAWDLNPWDADIVKRIARTKNIPGMSIQEARIEDYEKIIHNCKERISQLKEAINVK